MKSERFRFYIFFAISISFHLFILIQSPDKNVQHPHKNYTFLEIYQHPAKPVKNTPEKEYPKPNFTDRKAVKTAKFQHKYKAVTEQPTENKELQDNITKKNHIKPMEQTDTKQQKILAMSVNQETQPKPAEKKQTASKNSELPTENDTVKISDFDILTYTSYVKDFLQKTITYPYVARKRDIEGELMLEVVVEKNGKLSGYKILKSSGYEVLDKNTSDTLEDITLPNKPVLRTTLQFNLVYRLN